jgi:hypothetical protein
MMAKRTPEDEQINRRYRVRVVDDDGDDPGVVELRCRFCSAYTARYEIPDLPDPAQWEAGWEVIHAWVQARAREHDRACPGPPPRADDIDYLAHLSPGQRAEFEQWIDMQIASYLAGAPKFAEPALPLDGLTTADHAEMDLVVGAALMRLIATGAYDVPGVEPPGTVLYGDRLTADGYAAFETYMALHPELGARLIEDHKRGMIDQVIRERYPEVWAQWEQEAADDA